MDIEGLIWIDIIHGLLDIIIILRSSTACPVAAVPKGLLHKSQPCASQSESVLENSLHNPHQGTSSFSPTTPFEEIETPLSDKACASLHPPPPKPIIPIWRRPEDQPVIDALRASCRNSLRRKAAAERAQDEALSQVAADRRRRQRAEHMLSELLEGSGLVTSVSDVRELMRFGIRGRESGIVKVGNVRPLLATPKRRAEGLWDAVAGLGEAACVSPRAVKGLKAGLVK